MTKLTKTERMVRYLEAHGWRENVNTRCTKYREFQLTREGVVHVRRVGKNGAVRRPIPNNRTISITHLLWKHLVIWEARS